MTVAVMLSAAGMLAVGGSHAPSPAAQAVTPQSSSQTFIERHCNACHGGTARAGGVSLAGLDPERVAGQEHIWEKVLQKVRSRQMPPPRTTLPDSTERGRFVAVLEGALERSANENPSPGRVGAHRLNRIEYVNAVRDLLALEVDGAALLLPDESEEGFDNIAASLPLSSAHLERYMSAARRISTLALGDPSTGAAPGFEVYTVPWMLNQDVRVSDDLPFGSRGGATVRHRFPLDADYDIRIRLQRQAYHYIIGLGEPQQIDIRVDGNRVVRLNFGGGAEGVRAPLTWVGEIRAGEAFEIYMHAADDPLIVRVPVKAGTRSVGVAFVGRPWEPEGVPKLPHGTEFDNRFFDEKYDGYAAVDRIEIGGPFNPTGAGDTPSRRTILSCRPKSASDEDSCARSNIARLARRAYRRPVGDNDVEPLMKFYRSAKASGGFEAGMQAALERMLVSFNFLFRLERPPASAVSGSVYRLGDVELASRLSFFLWSSIPDDELLDLAAAGKLSEPGTLEAQVRRMLADPRSRALVDNFVSQWLTTRRAHTWQPNGTLFPDFDENLRQAMLEETAMFTGGQFRENRSILDLIRADYTWVNERLARHYGIPGIYGSGFRRVTFPDGRRGGILGQSSVLMVTSYPDRTAPVLRGKWVLDNLLGMPPPPPPPDVPPLEDTRAEGRVLTIREQMELHAKNPACSGCHMRMDPIGFALENFDAVGQWRNETGGRTLDVSATFPDGGRFEGVSGLRKVLLEHRSEFVNAFVTKLLTYALGRMVEPFDYPAARRIARDAAPGDYRWADLILGVVRSRPFLMGRTAS